MHALVFLAWLLVPIQALQVPFQVEKDDWDLSRPPNVNSTGHLIFATASSFMQHWPNTRYRNGHNLVIGTVPPNTLLYHGRTNNQIPNVPDWIATDPEHSYMFCRGIDEGCWHLTMVSTRPLKVLYFDGSSAAKMTGGPMDSQNVVAWGQVFPNRYFDERQRIADLCKWGKSFGVDGFVRMEMDFEIMLCDFTAGVEVISFLNLVSRRFDRPPNPLVLNSSAPGVGEEVIYSGSWHNHYPGDTRIRLDYSRLVSFYDTALVPSLVQARFGQTRLQHRLEGISDEDVRSMMFRLEWFLSDDTIESSSVDWETLLRVVQDRFSERLEILQYVLNTTETDTPNDLLVRAQKAHSQLHVMLVPYMLHSARPEPEPSSSWAVPIFEHCATTHTKFIHSSSLALTPSERLLLEAIDETNREICRVVVNMWVEGVQAGLDDIVKVPAIRSDTGLVERWGQEIDRLMSWLDWSVWLKCRPACSFEEICYLPTWPYFMGRPGNPDRRRPPEREPPPNPRSGKGQSVIADDPPDYEDPQPRCIRRIEPYGYF